MDNEEPDFIAFHHKFRVSVPSRVYENGKYHSGGPFIKIHPSREMKQDVEEEQEEGMVKDEERHQRAGIG